MDDRTRLNGDREGVRVVLVDDDALFRAALRELLAGEGVAVVGEGGTGGEALQLVRELAPDVVLLDLHLPVLDGVGATERIAAFAPEVRVVVLTISADERDVVDAVMGGACGYLLKDAPIAEIVAGITAAAHGESLLSPGVAGHLLNRLRQTSPPAIAGKHGELTARELEILALLAEGMENRQIADALYLSPKTVKNSVTRILKKLQLRNRIEAAVYATKRGVSR